MRRVEVTRKVIDGCDRCGTLNARTTRNALDEPELPEGWVMINMDPFERSQDSGDHGRMLGHVLSNAVLCSGCRDAALEWMRDGMLHKARFPRPGAS